jgi:hypothetical protein
MHTKLQCAVAIEYGVSLGKPVYFIDADAEVKTVVDAVIAKAKLSA